MTCWLCRYEAGQDQDNVAFVHVDLVYLCLDCLVHLAEQALPDDQKRHRAAAETQRRRAVRAAHGRDARARRL